jgi:hypothetical protein
LGTQQVQESSPVKFVIRGSDLMSERAQQVLISSIGDGLDDCDIFKVNWQAPSNLGLSL